MKRNISVILVLTMLLTAFPLTPYAQNYEFELSGKTADDAVPASNSRIIKSSAARANEITANFENEEEGVLANGYRGSNFSVKNSQPTIDTIGVYSEGGNKFARLSNEEYDGNSTSCIAYKSVDNGGVVNVSYKIRFIENAPKHWLLVNIGLNNVSAGFFNDGRFGINYGGDFAKNPRAQEKYDRYEVYFFSPKADVWYTFNYKIDYNDQSYDLSVIDEEGIEQIADTDKATGIPFRNANGAVTAANMGECRFTIPHNAFWNSNKQPGTATTAAFAFDLDDITSCAVDNENIVFDVIGEETLSNGTNEFDISYYNSMTDAANISQYLAVYDDGVLADVFEKDITLPTGKGHEIVSYDIEFSKYSGTVTYDVFMTDSASGATLCTAGGSGGDAPSNFVSADFANGILGVTIGGNNAYKAGFVTVKDPNDNLVYIGENTYKANSEINIDISDKDRYADGIYTISATLSDESGAAVTETVTVACYNDKKVAALAEINACNADNIGAAMAKYASLLNLELGGEYSVKHSYVDYLVANEIPFAQSEDVKAAFDAAMEKAAAIIGDFSRQTLIDCSAETKTFDFENCTPTMTDKTIYNENYTVYMKSQGSVGYVRDGDNTYLSLDQTKGVDNANSIYFSYKLPIAQKQIVSYRMRVDKSNSAFTTFYIGGASNLYLFNNKFSLHMGSSQRNISDTVTEGMWYTIVSDFDMEAQKYDLRITADDGTKLVDLKGVDFRNSVTTLGSLTLSCAQAESASKISLDDIKIISYDNSDLIFSVEGTKSLLPGENVYDINFMNMTGDDREPTLYLFVYNGDTLDRIEKKKFAVANGINFSDSMTINAAPSEFDSGNEISVKAYILDSLTYGLDYSASTEFNGDGEINAIVTTDYDNHKFDIGGNMPFDVLRVIILAPGKTEADALLSPQSSIVYYDRLNSVENINISAAIADNFGSGEYSVYLVSRNKDGVAFEKQLTAYYCGNSVADGIVGDFRKITAETAEATMLKYINTYPIMNDVDNFGEFYELNKTAVNATLIGSKSKLNTVSDIKKLLGTAYVAAALGNAADEAEFAKILEENSTLFGIDVSDSAYNLNKAETVSRLFAKRKALNAANIADEYKTALMLAEVNGADRTTIESVLEKYKSVIGIDTASAVYINNKSSVNKALTADGAVFNSAAEIVAAYNSALASSGSSGVAGGGGGGGSKVSGGGFGSTAVVAVDKPYVEPDTPLNSIESDFVDLSTVEWARESIERLKKCGVINGVNATHFEPDRMVAREEFAKMVSCAFGINGGSSNFEDVDIAAWYAPYVSALFSNGIINGVSQSRFGIGIGISRQDAAVILDRTAARIGKTLVYDVSALNTFSDFIAPYARESVLRLYQSGIVSGVSAAEFDAEGTLTRAQAAKIIDGLMQLAR